MLRQLELRLALAQLGAEDPATVASDACSRGLLHIARLAGTISSRQ